MASRKVCESILRGSSKVQLSCPFQSVRWTGLELSSRVGGFATELRKLGYKHGDKVGMCLPNSADNTVVQLAAAISGLSVVTAKTAVDLAEKVGELGCKGVVLSCSDESKLFSSQPLAHAPIISSNANESQSNDMTVHGLSTQGSVEDLKSFLDAGGDNENFAYYNSNKATTLRSLLTLGERTVDRLKLTEQDVLCVPVALCHSMGFGFGVLSALSASGGNSAIVLPSPSPNVPATLTALREDAISVLFADSHTLKALREVPDEDQFSSLRIGITKIGSGEAFDLSPAPEWGGVQFVTVGKPK